MADPKPRKVAQKELVELLTKPFIKCITDFSKEDWKPRWKGERATVNFLHIQDGKEINTEFGMQGFMRSVALNGKFFLDEGNGNSFSSDSRRNEFNELKKLKQYSDLEILQFSEITNSTRRTLETLIEKTTKSLPDSISIKIIRRKKKSKNTGVETPEEAEGRVKLHTTLARLDQGKFSEKIRNQYNHACVITGCNVRAALQAAHIKPFSKDRDDAPENGLLLRADLHLLFDRGLMAIDPDTGKVHFKNTGKHYNKYDQKIVDISKASRKNLTAHWHKFQNT